MIEHLSYSSISSYLLCGRSWRFKYIDKVPTLPTSSLILGSAVHDTIEKFVGEPGQSATEIFEKSWAATLRKIRESIGKSKPKKKSKKTDCVFLKRRQFFKA